MPWIKTLSASTDEQRLQSLPNPPNGRVSFDAFATYVNECEIDYALEKLQLFDTPGHQPDPRLLNSLGSSVRINVVGHAGPRGFSKSHPREVATRIQRLLQPLLAPQPKRIQSLPISIYLYGCSIGEDLDVSAPLKPDTYLHTFWTELNAHGVYVQRISAPRAFEWTDSNARSVVSRQGAYGLVDRACVKRWYQQLFTHWIEALCNGWMQRGQPASLYAPKHLIEALKAASTQLDETFKEGQNEGEVVVYDSVMQSFLKGLQQWHECMQDVVNGGDQGPARHATRQLLNELQGISYQDEANNALDHWGALAAPMADLLVYNAPRASEELFQKLAGYMRLYAQRCWEETGHRLSASALPEETEISQTDPNQLYVGDLSGRCGISAASPQWVGFDTSFDALVERALYEIRDGAGDTKGPNLGALLNMGPSKSNRTPVCAMFMDWWVFKGYATWVYAPGGGKNLPPGEGLTKWGGTPAAQTLGDELKKCYGFKDFGYNIQRWY